MNLNFSRWLFPLGAILAIGGLAMSAVSAFFLLLSLMGCLLAIVGAVFDKFRLAAEQLRVRGKLCLISGGLSLIAFWVNPNFHTWASAFFFVMLAGFTSGAVYFF